MKWLKWILPLAVFGSLAAFYLLRPHRDPALVEISDDPKLPNVLLIGDSISIGYTMPVREFLAGVANVHRPLDNCRTSQFVLDHLDTWLGNRHWDVIYFNAGLHDVKQVAGQPQTTPPPPDYRQNLAAIVARLKKTGAKLIWATTTPIPAGVSNWRAADEIEANASADRVMREQDVQIDDLHAVAEAHLAPWQLPNDLHFTEDGYRGLGEHVSAVIRSALPPR